MYNYGTGGNLKTPDIALTNYLTITNCYADGAGAFARAFCLLDASRARFTVSSFRKLKNKRRCGAGLFDRLCAEIEFPESRFAKMRASITRTENVMLTKKQLERFVRVRNKSPFSSNLQFQSDAEDCGFAVAELGDVTRLTPAGGYMWRPACGVLVERFGKCALYPAGTIIDARTGAPPRREDMEARFHD